MRRRDVLMAMGGVLLCGCSAGGKAKSSPGQRPVRADLYQCEGCEGVLERDAATLPARARIAPQDETGTPLIVTGTVLSVDGITPVSGVVIYGYHTNAAGLYANGSSETEASRRHGRLRGWVKTGSDGRYRFDTIKPAPYPNAIIPAHLHFTVLEPGKPSYWIDDIVFDGEFGVTPAYRRQMNDKGGNGILPLRRNADGTLHIVRDILLEPHPA